MMANVFLMMALLSLGIELYCIGKYRETLDQRWNKGMWAAMITCLVYCTLGKIYR